MELRVALLFVWFGILAVHGTTTPKKNTVTMDPEEKFTVSWSFDGTTPSSNITFTITCRTTGWVGIGLSEWGSMSEADLMVGWVNADGSSHLLDMYPENNVLPIEDMSQDVTLIYADESDGVTTIKFTRRLDTCSDYHDKAITSSMTRLIYAYKDSDPENGKIESSDYHGATNRGAMSVNLLGSSGVNKPEPFPTDTLSFDLRVNNFRMFAAETVYHCSFHDAPVIADKHHIIAIEPLISEGNLVLVHHIILYACHGIADKHLRWDTKVQGVCSNPGMPEYSSSCSSTVYAWAVGGGTFYYPEEVGYPIGGTDGTAPQYYMMQIHYNNPGLLDTFVDSSGLRIIYSPSLREHASGSLAVGLIEGIAVPPLTNNFRVVGYCHSSCTKEWIPAEGIQVFGYLLHTHLIGRSIQVDWYREGEHIGVLAYNDDYYFRLQQFRHFETSKKVMPGDTLKITCTYSNKAVDQIIYGGLATTEEMCIAYFMYYPRVDNIGDCTSFPQMTYFPDDPVFESLSINVTKDGDGTDSLHLLNKVTDWTDEAVAALQNAYDSSVHYTICMEDSDDLYAIDFLEFNVTDYKHVPIATEDPCNNIVRINPTQSGVSPSISSLVRINSTQSGASTSISTPTNFQPTNGTDYNHVPMATEEPYNMVRGNSAQIGVSHFIPALLLPAILIVLVL